MSPSLCFYAHHFDSTALPQTVTAEEDPWLHALLLHMGHLTGLPMLLNTSFNSKGRPILNTAAEA